MSDGTKIEWTDATANAINGCTVVSPGCANCYAMKQAHRFRVRQGLTRQSPSGMTWTGEVRLNDKVFDQVLRWTKPRRIFWNAHGDTFHKDVPDEWIDRMFAVLALTPQHTHQVLTKRPERMRDYLYHLQRQPGRMRQAARSCGATLLSCKDAVETVFLNWPLPNVWLGVSVEDQQRADERIPILLDTPAAVRWLSMEPLLGPVDLRKIELRRQGQPPTPLSLRLGDYIQPLSGNFRDSKVIDWVVLGGESGPGARPMHPDWARQVRDQCEAAGVPFHFKQWGNWAPDDLPLPKLRDPALMLQKGRISIYPDGTSMGRGFFPEDARNLSHLHRVAKHAAGRLLDGVQHDGFPA